MLHTAVRNHDIVSLKRSIDSGDDVNLVLGYTALYIASREGYGECVKLLLDAKADASKSCKYGLTPIRDASCKGHLEFVKVARVAGGGLTREFFLRLQRIVVDCSQGKHRCC